jgi:hypothetical protein
VLIQFFEKIVKIPAILLTFLRAYYHYSTINLKNLLSWLLSIANNI